MEQKVESKKDRKGNERQNRFPVVVILPPTLKFFLDYKKFLLEQYKEAHQNSYKYNSYLD